MPGLFEALLEKAARTELCETAAPSSPPDAQPDVHQHQYRTFPCIMDLDETDPRYLGAVYALCYPPDTVNKILVLEEQARKRSMQSYPTPDSTVERANHAQLAAAHDFAHSSCMRLVALSRGLGSTILHNEDKRSAAYDNVHKLVRRAVQAERAVLRNALHDVPDANAAASGATSGGHGFSSFEVMLQLALTSLQGATAGDDNDGSTGSSRLKTQVLRILQTLVNNYPPFSLVGIHPAVPSTIKRAVKSICKVLLGMLDPHHAEDIFRVVLGLGLALGDFDIVFDSVLALLEDFEEVRLPQLVANLSCSQALNGDLIFRCGAACPPHWYLPVSETPAKAWYGSIAVDADRLPRGETSPFLSRIFALRSTGHLLCVSSLGRVMWEHRCFPPTLATSRDYHHTPMACLNGKLYFLTGAGEHSADDDIITIADFDVFNVQSKEWERRNNDFGQLDVEGKEDKGGGGIGGERKRDKMRFVKQTSREQQLEPRRRNQQHLLLATGNRLLVVSLVSRRQRVHKNSDQRHESTSALSESHTIPATEAMAQWIEPLADPKSPVLPPTILPLRIPKRVRWCARKQARQNRSDDGPAKTVLCLRPTTGQICRASSVFTTINCGGGALTFTEEMKTGGGSDIRIFSKDAHFVASPAVPWNTAHCCVARSGINIRKDAKTSPGADLPDAVYHSYRQHEMGIPFGYSIPVPGSENGSYLVELHFVEPEFHAPGARIFDVAVNGRIVRMNMDIFREAGYRKNTPVVVRAIADMSVAPPALRASGRISISLIPDGSSTALVCAVTIRRFGKEVAQDDRFGGLVRDHPSSDGRPAFLDGLHR